MHFRLSNDSYRQHFNFEMPNGTVRMSHTYVYIKMIGHPSSSLSTAHTKDFCLQCFFVFMLPPLRHVTTSVEFITYTMQYAQINNILYLTTSLKHYHRITQFITNNQSH